MFLPQIMSTRTAAGSVSLNDAAVPSQSALNTETKEPTFGTADPDPESDHEVENEAEAEVHSTPQPLQLPHSSTVLNPHMNTTGFTHGEKGLGSGNNTRERPLTDSSAG